MPGGEWCAVDIEVAVELGVGGEFGIDPQSSTQHVECCLGLGKKFVPKVQGKVFVNAAETSDKMVFERANRTFGGVTAVDTGWDELEVDGFFG